MKEPLISVIMSVFNTNQEYLSASISSILNQTLPDFEFIIIDDASDQEVQTVINNFDDNRIKFYRNKKNLGLTVNLNKAINISKGKYIARMDADDISLLDRFEKQVNFLESNPEVGVLGGSALVFGDTRRIINANYREHEEIKGKLMIESPMIHPTVMMRSKLIKKNLYNEDYRTAQDYELWSRLIWKTKFANLKDILLKYRIHEGQVTVKKSKEQYDNAKNIREKMLFLINTNIEQNNLELIHKSVSGLIRNKEDVVKVRDLSNKLIVMNRIKLVYSEQALIKVLSENLDRLNYLYGRDGKRLPIKNLKLSPNHKINKFSYQKYLGGIYGAMKNLF